MTTRRTTLAVSTTTAGGAGVAVGVGVANTDAMGKVLDSAVTMFAALDPTVALMAILFLATGTVCWLRTGHFREDLASQYRALAALRDFAIENRGLHHRIMDKLGLPLREIGQPVSTERRETALIEEG